MTDGVARVAAVMRLELRTQRREPLVWLCALVLGVVAFAFAAGGPIDLVQGRGAVPRSAPWSLALAGTAIAAFGQVLTTMVSATAVLRDDAVRLAPVRLATRLTPAERLAGMLLGVLLVLLVVYAVVPIALVAGAWWHDRTLAAVGPVLRAWGLVVLPVMAPVAILQVSVAACTRRLWAVVAVGLLLLWAWSAAVSAARHGEAGAWVLAADPFGSAPVLAATWAWSDAARRTATVPLGEAFLLGRGAWLLVAVAAATLAARTTGSASLVGTKDADPVVEPVVEPAVGAAVVGVRAIAVVLSTARLTARWMTRDGGFRVLLLLGAMNVGVHVWLDVRTAAAADAQRLAAFRALLQHSRLFLILLATIYAGEVVWRARDVRLEALLTATAAPRYLRALGDLLGTLSAQALVIVGLAALVQGLAAVAAGGWVFTVPWLVAMLISPGLIFAIWMLGSVVVHAVVQQKIVAHLLLIAGWTLAVARSAERPDAVWQAVDLPLPATALAGETLPPTATVAWLGLGLAGALLAAVGALGRGTGTGDRALRRHESAVAPPPHLG